MKKIIYTFFILFLISTVYFSYKIVSDQYDKQNLFILKIKEIVPTKLKNNLRNYIYDFRASINKDEIEKLQEAKLKQGLNGELIQSKNHNGRLEAL